MMEEYQASIASVDTALNRLNQTLASYKLFVSKSTTTATVRISSETPGNQPQVPPPSNPQSVTTPAPFQEPASPRTAARNQLLGAILALRSTKHYPEREISGRERLSRIVQSFDFLRHDPYSIPAYILLATEYLGLGYPDLAAGSAYKALLLSDALDNDAEEYHDEASESLKFTIQGQALEERIRIIRNAMEAGIENASPTELDPTLDVEIALWLRTHYRLIMYRILTRSLLLCGSFRSANDFLHQGFMAYPEDPELVEIRKHLHEAVRKVSDQAPNEALSSPKEWPDNGLVRRELYPWNDREPDRIADLDQINMLMANVSEKLEVRAVDLPPLNGDTRCAVTQLGVFAKEDIAPGEIILDEKSLLTANNKLQDALCDACSGDLPEVGSEEWANAVVCAECEVVFCSDWCFENARDSYHPAVCGKDVEAIAKDVPPAEAADSLYSLLLLRTLAMAETQEWHPLELLDIRYIWGDFTPVPKPNTKTYADLTSPSSCLIPRTLPFSFENNIRLPFHMLEKMDVDIFANPHYDVWVFNTLYAKFRGTASARLSGQSRGSRMRGPEVSAVHPMWCMANHSCDPNVSWEWGGEMKFWVKQERAVWKREGGGGEVGGGGGGGGEGKVVAKAGIKKDEEVLNHYCDVDLPVATRREWARGALGGDCQCERCRYEAGEEEQKTS